MSGLDYSVKGDGALLSLRLSMTADGHIGEIGLNKLRLHLAAIGHPILGDALYAPPELQARAPRLLLHASELRLTHPTGGTALLLRCAPPF